MWTDLIYACGRGVDFTEDARIMVEAACMTEGRLIARKPDTGAVIWDYQRQLTLISHCPIIDPETDYVYAVFDDGYVVSLKSDSGITVWETLLPFPVKQPTSASYDLYWSCISVDSDFVLIIDHYDTIYVLDKMSGRIIGHFDVISATTQYGIRVPTTELVAMPRFVNDTLIVVTKHSIKAFNLI
jgi:outer membrane protein assembly factor BamB